MERRDPPPPPPAGGDDGVRVTERARGVAPGRVAGLVVLAVVAGVVGWRLLATRTAAQAGERAALGAQDAAREQAASASAGMPAAAARPAPTRGPTPAAPQDGEDPTPDLSDYVLRGEAPSMAEVIEALHARGIRSGLGAFPPPGTRPPLVGLEVPEGFPLPEGYVRHHQATDDGQRIAPILMFHPDLTHVQLNGRRVPVPADRVVTPALAPPGMPLRRVRIPPPRDGGGGP